MSAKHVLVCWECGKEHDCVPLSQRPYLCDCGGYVVSPSGKVMLKRLDESSATYLCKQCGRPGRITEDNETHCEYCGPGAALVSVPDEESVYVVDCPGGRCEW